MLYLTLWIGRGLFSEKNIPYCHHLCVSFMFVFLIHGIFFGVFLINCTMADIYLHDDGNWNRKNTFSCDRVGDRYEKGSVIINVLL